MEIEVRTTHLNRRSWALPLAEEFQKKISFFEKTQFKIFKDESKWLEDIHPKDRVYVCDERGKSFTSKEFSSEFSKLRDGGVQKIILFVGGPFGLPDAVKSRADKSICLSSFVLNQEVALILLMEQIFRAYTIINNHPYHNS